MEIEKTHRINLLMDIYSSFLTSRQIQILELYFKEDFSLSEISKLLEISRNAVYDSLQSSILKLEDFETKLKLLKKEENKTKLLKDFDKISKEKIKKEIKEKL